MDAFENMVLNHLVNDDTIIALHDTNLHPTQICSWAKYIPTEDGYEHQRVEREMVNIFKCKGYDIFSIRTKKDSHDTTLPFRHGITICQKFKYMKLS